jgi:hypothetical protein
VLLGRAHAEVAGLEELAVPGAPLFEVGDVLLRQVLLEPGPHLLGEGDVLGRVVQVHKRDLLLEVPAFLARGAMTVNLAWWDVRQSRDRASCGCTGVRP